MTVRTPERYPDDWDDAPCSICDHAPSSQRPAAIYMADPCIRRKLVIVAQRRAWAERRKINEALCGAFCPGDYLPCLLPKNHRKGCEFIDPWGPTKEEMEESRKTQAVESALAIFLTTGRIESVEAD